jgi:hypothetical protein
MPQPDSYACTAKLAGRPIAGRGKGGCTWRLPKRSRGKTLVVSLTVVYEGATKTFSFPYRVG